MMKPIRHIRRTLALKLTSGFLLLTMIIFGVALTVLYLQSRAIIRREARERVQTELNTTVQRLRTVLGTIETATESNDWLVTEHLNPDSLLNLSQRIVMLNRNVNGCSISMEPNTFPQYGRYFSAYSIVKGDTVVTEREGAYEYFDAVWYKTPKMLGKACWVDPFNDYNPQTLYTTEMIASYCKPLYQGDRLIGIISTDLALRQLAKLVKAVIPYPHAYYMMIGKEGQYFVHPDTTRLFQQGIFTDVNPRKQADIIALGHEMTAGKQGGMKVTMDGVPSLVCYQPVPQTAWSVALVCPESDILYSYQKLHLVIIIIAFIGLLAIAILTTRIVRHAVRPLKTLLKQSQEIAAGHYDMQIAQTRRADAVGKLQNAFTFMQQSLRQHVSDIEQANATTQQRNEELAQATLQAEESERQKTAFIQNMTHQVRTPLNIIMGFGQVVRDSKNLLSDEERSSISSMLYHNATILNRMVLMLYDSSETGQMEEQNIKKQMEPTLINDVALESVNFAREHFPDLPITFATTLDDSEMMTTNRLYLMRSLRELMYNAAKYSDGQHVGMIVSKTPDGKIRFVVQDTGPGIPVDTQEMLYTPFTKVNVLSEGLGLGLPLTMRHVETLGGTITLDTTYHDGCRFVIDMPQ